MVVHFIFIFFFFLSKLPGSCKILLNFRFIIILYTILLYDNCTREYDGKYCGLVSQTFRLVVDVFNVIIYDVGPGTFLRLCPLGKYLAIVQTVQNRLFERIFRGQKWYGFVLIISRVAIVRGCSIIIFVFSTIHYSYEQLIGTISICRERKNDIVRSTPTRAEFDSAEITIDKDEPGEENKRIRNFETRLCWCCICARVVPIVNRQYADYLIFSDYQYSVTTRGSTSAITITTFFNSLS